MNATPFLPVRNEHAALLKHVQEALQDVAIAFERQLASDLSPVNRLCLHVEHYRGKMLRPTLVLVSAAAFREATLFDEDDAQHNAARALAAVVEMIHAATLVHDDVLDEAAVRRRGSTVNHLWGNEMAVMLGDYLISNAFHLCSTIGDPSLNLALGEVTNTLCEGELLQLSNRDHLGLDEETYMQIIRRKTGALIQACCQLGATLAGADTKHAAALGHYGMEIGVAFQIQDDLLDLVGDQSIVGKSLGRDLEKCKLTLPLIRALQQADVQQRATIVDAIEATDDVAVRSIIQQLGTDEDARHTAREHVAQARKHLQSIPESPAKLLLDDMAAAVVNRQH